MKNLMTPNITLVVVLLAALAAVALRAAARRPEPRWAPGAESAPITVRTPGPPGQWPCVKPSSMLITCGNVAINGLERLLKQGHWAPGPAGQCR